MNEDKIDDLISRFEYSLIENIEFNVFKKIITIYILCYEENEEKHHVIEFGDVSGFSFFNDVQERRQKFVEWEIAEISEIIYSENSKDEINYICDKAGFPAYSAKVNIFIQMWNALLLIETGKISVDNNSYIIQKPNGLQ